MPSTYLYETKQGLRYGYIAEVGINPNTGKRMQKKKQGFKTEKEALLAGAEVEKNALEGKLTITKNPTFEEIYKQWFELKKANTKSSTQYQLQKTFESTILPRFRKLKIKDISIAYCQQQINELSEFQSVSIYKAEISAVFKYAVQIDLILKNPMDFVILPRRSKRKKKKQKNFLEKQEVQIFLKTAKNDFKFMEYAFFHLLFFSGMRKGEVCGLQWDDINFGTQEIHIEHTLTYSKEKSYYLDEVKGGHPRTIDIDGTTLGVLKKWKLQQPKEKIDNKYNFVFTRTGGYPLRLAWPNDILKMILDKANLPLITVHGTRHTHASLLFESGAKIKDVQERLGHSETKMTLDVYTHVTSFARKETSDAFAAYMNIDF